MRNNQNTTQFLINELINNASTIYSEFPMKAAQARNRVQALKDELLKHIETLETQSTNLST